MQGKSFELVIMEFKLNEYHRDVSDEELLDDLRRVAELLSKENLTMSEYQENGKYHPSTIANRFGGWRNSLKKAGLSLTKTWAKHEYCEDETLFFEDMQLVANKLNKEYITARDYKQFGKFDLSATFRKYGSWNIMLQKAGLKPTPYRLGKGKEITDEELFQDIERVWIKLGRQPTINDVKNGEFNFAQNTFTRRFGGWRGALEAFVKYINSEDVSEDLNEDVPDSTSNEIITPESNGQSAKSQHSTTHKTRRDINLRLRFKVMARDNFKCCKCGRSPATDPTVVLHVDHKYPWVKGGETTMENLETTCKECNLGKGDLVFEE